MAPSVSQERLLERKPHVLFGGSFGRSVSSGRNISKDITTSAVHSLKILRYPGELLEFCDVTRVLETPTALKTHSLGAYKARF